MARGGQAVALVREPPPARPETSDESPDMLTVEEVAAILRVDRKTVYAEIAAGRIPCLRLGRRGRVMRIARSVVALLTQGRVVPHGGFHGGSTR